jgi:Erg28 like protein
MYTLCLWTFSLAWFHFTSEWFVYKTAAPGPGLLSPVIVSSNDPTSLNTPNPLYLAPFSGSDADVLTAVSLIWMYVQREYYLS